MNALCLGVLTLLAVANGAPQITTTTEAPQVFPCVCTMDYRPVCGVDGVTYGNRCGMNCAKVGLAHDGSCDAPVCVCPKILEYVCGSDGKTYQNKCLLNCAGAVMVHQGQCVTTSADVPCICPFIYLPVCGADGITYGNDCSMKCDGVELATNGACPTSPPPQTTSS